MGERTIVEMAEGLDSGLDISDIIYIQGSTWKTTNKDYLPTDGIFLPSFKELKIDKIFNVSQNFFQLYLY